MTAKKKFSRFIFRFKICLGLTLLSLCIFYFLQKNIILFIPWFLAFMFFLLGQIKNNNGERSRFSRKVPRY